MHVSRSPKMFSLRNGCTMTSPVNLLIFQPFLLENVWSSTLSREAFRSPQWFSSKVCYGLEDSTDPPSITASMLSCLLDKVFRELTARRLPLAAPPCTFAAPMSVYKLPVKRTPLIFLARVTCRKKLVCINFSILWQCTANMPRGCWGRGRVRDWGRKACYISVKRTVDWILGGLALTGSYLSAGGRARGDFYTGNTNTTLFSSQT